MSAVHPVHWGLEIETITAVAHLACVPIPQQKQYTFGSWRPGNDTEQENIPPPKLLRDHIHVIRYLEVYS